jgi:hypothetical protein
MRREVILFLIRQMDAAAMALLDIAHLTFKKRVTAAAGLLFVLAHA